MWVGVSIVLSGFAPTVGGLLIPIVLVVWLILLGRLSYLARRTRHKSVP
jgi:hypothetical protein